MTDAPPKIWASIQAEYASGLSGGWATDQSTVYPELEIPYIREDFAQARIAVLEEHVSELLTDLPCACGLDSPTDICMGHLPAFRKQQARIAELEAAFATARNDILREVSVEIECNWGHIATPEMRDSILSLTAKG